MKLDQINNINFNRKIIDSHVHIGHWQDNGGKIYDTTPDLDLFVKSPLENGDTIEKVIVSNLDCMVHKKTSNGKIEFKADEIEGNKKILNLASKNNKLAPLAVCQPGYGSVDNIKKLINENPDKFCGLKFHPEQLNIAADSEVFYPYMDFAKEKKLPCLFHSGNTFDVIYEGGGIGKATQVSKPEQIYNLAKKYKDVPVIMAHWGGDGEKNIDKTTDCIITSIKNKDALLYGDISWVDCNNPEKPNIKRIIEKLKKEKGLDRILFGTDAPLGRFGKNGENGIPPQKAYTDTINDIKSMIQREFPEEAESIIDKIFHDNADNLFFKPITPPKPRPKPKKTGSRSVWIAIAGLTVLAAVIMGLYLHNHSAQSKKRGSDS